MGRTAAKVIIVAEIFIMARIIRNVKYPTFYTVGRAVMKSVQLPHDLYSGCLTVCGRLTTLRLTDWVDALVHEGGGDGA